jgi:Fic family protein
VDSINNLHEKWLSMPPLDPKLKRDMDQQFMVDFNYNSNHLEGNTLTYGQTKLLLLFGDTIGNANMQDYEEMKAHNVLLRNNYPMIVIRTDDRTNYLKSLHQCDLLTGKATSDGAHATLEQTKPLVEYIKTVVTQKLTAVLQLAKGEINELIEAKNNESSDKKSTEKVTENQQQIINELIKNKKVTSKELSDIIGISAVKVRENLAKLKAKKMIKRIGGDRGGYWEIIKK